VVQSQQQGGERAEAGKGEIAILGITVKIMGKRDLGKHVVAVKTNAGMVGESFFLRGNVRDKRT